MLEFKFPKFSDAKIPSSAPTKTGTENIYFISTVERINTNLVSGKEDFANGMVKIKNRRKFFFNKHLQSQPKEKLAFRNFVLYISHVRKSNFCFLSTHFFLQFLRPQMAFSLIISSFLAPRKSGSTPVRRPMMMSLMVMCQKQLCWNQLCCSMCAMMCTMMMCCCMMMMCCCRIMCN